MPRIRLKRAYEEPSADDGPRLLVERLWPRGVSKERGAIDRWFKELAPSPELRKWYAHEPERWPEFQRRYRSELEKENEEEMEALLALCAERPVTFIFAARDQERNSAVVLREFVLERIGKG